MVDIFISYASEDRDRIKPLANALAEQGWSVFWDFTIPVGKTWRQIITEALNAAKCAVVAWSSTSINSDWVQEEAEDAKGRRILAPTMIDEVIPPLGFRSMQAARLMNWTGETKHPEFQKLLNSIEEILGLSPLKVKAEEHRRKDEKQLGKAYDFDRFLTQYPRQKGDRRRLNRERTSRNLLDLRAKLEDPMSLNSVPPKSDTRLLLATWNIQHFGSTKRYDESLWYLAEILSRFDLIAIQEVYHSLRDLEIVTRLLGPWWKYIFSDIVPGRKLRERIVYLFDNRRVQWSGLAGEIPLSPIEGTEGGQSPARQLARVPYMAEFMVDGFSFLLSTFHLIWGEEVQRVEEVEQITNLLVNRKSEHGARYRNMILLGDFDLFDPNVIAARALKNSGFSIPHGLRDVRATNVGQKARFYDQIAYLFEDLEGFDPISCGIVDCFDAVYTDEKFEAYREELRTSSGAVPSDPWRYYRQFWRVKEMSDHLLLWAQLPIDFSNTHLTAMAT